MSVDVASPIAESKSPTANNNNHMMEQGTNGRRSGVLNVWTATSVQHSLLEVDDEDDSQYSSRKPSAVSSLDDQLEEEERKLNDTTVQTSYRERLDTLRSENEHHQKAFQAALHLLDGIMEDNRRKTSDPTVSKRRAEVNTNTVKKQRCFSDTTGIHTLLSSGNIGGIIPDDTSSALGCDSGIVDCMLHQSTTALSEPECKSEDKQRKRKQTPATIVRSGSLDEGVFRKLQQDESSSSSSKPRQRRGNLTKHLSLSSMGGSSDNYSLLSCFDIISTDSIATELLSSLGFGDFDSPLLIPDRFIPQAAEAAKPSVMFEQTLLGAYSMSSYTPPEPQISCSVINSNAELRHDFELPLGATADNFIPTKANRPLSPPPLSPIETLPPPIPDNPPHTGADPSLSVYNRKYIQLETVPEETASDLSPSPRWLSPRVSLDHSCLDFSTGQLGASLNVANRKRSLPNREGYRMSMESLLSEQDSTVYFSITSYDDDLAKEKEETSLHLPSEDSTINRRRRKGVHYAPPELLTWLQDQNSLLQDEEELPWPFNERAQIRRSLTEYQQQQRLSSCSSYTLDDRSLSSSEDPLEGVFQRRFSVNGPLLAPSNPSAEVRRLSLPSSSSYGHFKSKSPAPPSKGTALDSAIDEECSRLSPEIEEFEEVQYQNNTKLPPGMSREEALEYKRESNVLREELNVTQQKLRDAERVRRSEEETHFKRISDTEEWLRSELWGSERKKRELEEELERVSRDYKLLQQNQQISIARAKEEMRDSKNKEISALKNKMEQKSSEFREKITKLEEECRYLRSKESQLLKKTSQHGLKAEKEELLKELSRVKEQLRQEKQLSASSGKEKASEMKQLRAKAQLEKEEALKNQKEYLTKIHHSELTSLRQIVQQTTVERESLQKPSRSFHANSPSKLETKKLHYQIDKLSEDLHRKEEELAEMTQQMKLLHKEHMQLQKQLMNFKTTQ